MTVAWLVGRFDSSETAPIAAELPALLPGVSAYSFGTPADALRSDAPPADLILVAQHRPGEFPRRDAEALVGSQPLACLVVGLGLWCESHHRSERLWPETATVPLRGLLPRLRREADATAGQAERLPVTASRDELFLVAPVSGGDLSHFKIAVVSPDAAFRSMLRDLAHAFGAEPCEPAEAIALLYDADPLRAESLARLTSLRLDRPQCRFIAFTALPTPADSTRLRRAGADAVLPKPFDVADLSAALAHIRPVVS